MKVRRSLLVEGVENSGDIISAEAKARIATGAWGRRLKWMIVAAIAVAYLADLSPGHVFVNDDFAAYVMHAANLVMGRPYANIHYVPNPKALWLAPSNGYPPVYPLILAPVYKALGLNLRAFKAVTVLCFVVFVVIFESLMRPKLSASLRIWVLLILAANPIFWNQRDYILSEFPYLMFSFAALLVIEKVYRTLTPDKVRIGMVAVLSALLYCSYGTRTIGIVLLGALVLADVVKFRRPSRFMMAVVAGTLLLILFQGIFISSPTGYISAIRISPRASLVNTVYYAKTLSYLWQNGFSKGVQIAFALILTALASIGFARHLWKERSAQEFYLFGYVGILILWSAEIGLRGLLPILPLYFVYGFEEIGRILAPLSNVTRRSALASLLIFCGATYLGEFRKEARQPAEANVADLSAQQLFSFVKEHTEPSEVIISPKPRSLALFTNHSTASFGPGESPEDSGNFMKSIHARIIVKPDWSPPSWAAFLQNNKKRVTEIFHNSEYTVFCVDGDPANLSARQ